MGKRSNVCKFPVARIKKIMQADEEVGKVAQATPVVVCKWMQSQPIWDRTLTNIVQRNRWNSLCSPFWMHHSKRHKKVGSAN